MGDFSEERGGDGALRARVNPVHLRRRLGIESEPRARLFGHGLNALHVENLDTLHAALAWVLRLVLLAERGRRNVRRLDLRRNEVVVAGLDAAFDGYTILHVSDPHLDLHPDIARVLRDRIRGVACDLAVFTGDFVASTRGRFDDALDALATVRPHLDAPVYAVLGNHDSIRIVTRMEAMGIRVLLNEAVTIGRGAARLHLAGVDDPHYFEADNIEKACEGLPPDEPSILLAHSPEIYRHAAHAGFDLMLCGHTHGGQICLPGGFPVINNASCPRRLCRGAWRHHGLQGYTSAGSGVSSLDARFNCPPEITLHRLASR